MKVFAHVLSDGSIHGLVVQPEGEVRAMQVPEAGIEVREITGHGLKWPVDVKQLRKLREEYRVDLTSSKAKLIRRDDKSDS